jgi:hypothetical protein
LLYIKGVCNVIANHTPADADSVVLVAEYTVVRPVLKAPLVNVVSVVWPILMVRFVKTEPLLLVLGLKYIVVIIPLGELKLLG